MDNTIRIAIVEDHMLMRTELLELFAHDSRFEVVITAHNFNNALESSAASRFDVLLLDLHLPDGNGADLIRHFRAQQPDLKVVVLTVHHDASHALQAMEHGVDAYILKDDENLKAHIIAVSEGEHPLDPRVTGHLLSRLSANQPHNASDLTPRELQTLTGLYRGMSYHQLAEHMNISHNTLPGYVKNLYRKLGVNSRSQAVYRATQLGLIGH